MKKEKLILSLTALIIGILVSVGGFFLYQSTKEVKPSEIKKITINNPSPTPQSSIFLTVDRPKDEEVVNKRIITVSGKTIPDAKIVILTQSNEEAAVASRNGSFSTEITLDENENIVEISATAPNGEVVKIKRTVIYSTEVF